MSINIYIGLKNLVSNLSFSDRIRISIYNNVNSKTNSYDGAQFLIGSEKSSINKFQYYIGNVGNGYNLGIEKDGTYTGGVSTKNSTDNQIIIDIPNLIGKSVILYTANYGTDWEVDTNFRSRGNVNISNTYYENYIDLTSGFYFYIAPQIGESALPVNWRIKRIRIEKHI